MWVWIILCFIFLCSGMIIGWCLYRDYGEIDLNGKYLVKFDYTTHEEFRKGIVNED